MISQYSNYPPFLKWGVATTYLMSVRRSYRLRNEKMIIRASSVRMSKGHSCVSHSGDVLEEEEPILFSAEPGSQFGQSE